MKGKKFTIPFITAVVFMLICSCADVHAAEDNVFYMSAGGVLMKVQMADTAAARELNSMLAEGDLTINMTGNSFEQYGSLGKTLTAADAPITAQAGDVLLYNSNILCVFYGSNSYSYTRIGKIQDMSESEIKNILSGKNLAVTLSNRSFGTVPDTGAADRILLKKMVFFAGGFAALSWCLMIKRRVRDGKIARIQKK